MFFNNKHRHFLFDFEQKVPVFFWYFPYSSLNSFKIRFKFTANIIVAPWTYRQINLPILPYCSHAGFECFLFRNHSWTAPPGISPFIIKG
jgi:hypothetical protein